MERISDFRYRDNQKNRILEKHFPYCHIGTFRYIDHGSLVPWFLGSRLPGFPASRLPGFPASRLPGFPASRLPGFPATISFRARAHDANPVPMATILRNYFVQFDCN
jgi:hypothetical protein